MSGIIRSRKRAYKTELKPNNEQKTKLKMHAGTARVAYNWGLAYRKKLYEQKKETINAIGLHKELNKLKKEEFEWMYKVSKCAPQEALRDLDKGFINFFSGRAKYPRFKKKKTTSGGSFRLTGSIKVWSDQIQLPRLGKIRLKERNYLPQKQHILSVTISTKAGRWFVSVLVEEDYKVPLNNKPAAGVDLGVKELAIISDGSVFTNPKALPKKQRKLKRQQRAFSRTKKSSKNRKKAVERLQKTHFKISSIRSDAINKATSYLAKTKSIIVLEDLNVKGMIKNHKLALVLSDASFGEFRRQMEYKTQWYGSRIIYADRFFPSSKMCSACGTIKKDLKLSDRLFTCESCGLKIDRDFNASLNLLHLAGSSSESLNACLRREVTEQSLMVSQCSSMMQESNTKPNV
ncbi:MAG: RNA-guided endonuclease InsQ/TnpB family protein [Candidatus Kariarchaeaceae archaeon]